MFELRTPTYFAALKDIVHNGSKDQVREVIKMLLERLKSATDWLVSPLSNLSL